MNVAEDVERELSRQMKALQGKGDEPVQRARMSNLVIFCASRQQGDHIAAQIRAERIHFDQHFEFFFCPGNEGDGSVFRDFALVIEQNRNTHTQDFPGKTFCRRQGF